MQLAAWRSKAICRRPAQAAAEWLATLARRPIRAAQRAASDCAKATPHLLTPRRLSVRAQRAAPNPAGQIRPALLAVHQPQQPSPSARPLSFPNQPSSRHNPLTHSSRTLRISPQRLPERADPAVRTCPFFHAALSSPEHPPAPARRPCSPPTQRRGAARSPPPCSVPLFSPSHFIRGRRTHFPPPPAVCTAPP